MADIFSNAVKATTQTQLLPKVVDNVLTDNVGLGRFVKNAKSGKKKLQGRVLEITVQTSRLTDGSFSFFRGGETFDRSVQNVMQKMQYDPTFAQQSVVVLDTEISINMAAGTNKMLDLVELSLEQAQNALADQLGNAFYSDGTTFGGKAFFGLEALVDDGTNTSTIGGLSRTTYPLLKSTVTASGGTLTLQKLHTLYNAVKSGSVTPTLILTTESLRSFYELLLTPAIRFSDSNTLSNGARKLEFQGIEVLSDEKCPSGTLYMLNEKFIQFYNLPYVDSKPVPYANIIEGNNYDKDTIGLGFSWSGDFVSSYNQGVKAGDIYFAGQFVNSKPAASGKLTGVTGI